MCYDTCLHQAIHSIFYSYMYVAIILILIIFHVILVYDLLWNEVDLYLVKFGLIHWFFQVEVLDIYYKVFYVWGG